MAAMPCESVLTNAQTVSTEQNIFTTFTWQGVLPTLLDVLVILHPKICPLYIMILLSHFLGREEGAGARALNKSFGSSRINKQTKLSYSREIQNRMKGFTSLFIVSELSLAIS